MPLGGLWSSNRSAGTSADTRAFLVPSSPSGVSTWLQNKVCICENGTPGDTGGAYISLVAVFERILPENDSTMSLLPPVETLDPDVSQADRFARALQKTRGRPIDL